MLTKIEQELAERVNVTAMRCGPPFQVGKFYLMREGVASREARLAGPFDDAQEAADSREVVGVRRAVVCREVSR